MLSSHLRRSGTNGYRSISNSPNSTYGFSSLIRSTVSPLFLRDVNMSASRFLFPLCLLISFWLISFYLGKTQKLTSNIAGAIILGLDWKKNISNGVCLWLCLFLTFMDVLVMFNWVTKRLRLYKILFRECIVQMMLFDLCFFVSYWSLNTWCLPNTKGSSMINTPQEEVVSKTWSFDKMKSKAEKCSLTQSDKLCNEKNGVWGCNLYKGMSFIA